MNYTQYRILRAYKKILKRIKTTDIVKKTLSIFIFMIMVLNVSAIDINWNIKYVNVVNDKLGTTLTNVKPYNLVYHEIYERVKVTSIYDFNIYYELNELTYVFDDNSNELYEQLKQELVNDFGDYMYSNMISYYNHLKQSTKWVTDNEIITLERLVDKGYFVNIILKIKKK